MTIADPPKATAAIQTLFIQKDRLIAVPMDIVFETMMQPHGGLWRRCR